MLERRIFVSAILFLSTLGVFGWGCEKKEVVEEEKDGKKVVARVGDEVITLKDLNEDIKKLPPHVKKRMDRVEEKKKHLNKLVERKLLLQEAGRKGLIDAPDIVRQVENYRGRLIVQRLLSSVKKEVAPVTEEDVKEYFEKNKAQFQIRKKIKARHILLKDEAEAKKVLKKAKAPGADFAKLAAEYSQDRATKGKGGDLGYFSPGRMVRQFEDIAFSMKKPGDISNTVKTPFGYHIIKLEDKKPAEPKPFAQVKVEIRRRLTSQRQNESQEKFLEEIKSRIRIEINEALLGEKAKPKAVPKPPVKKEKPAEGAEGEKQ